PLEQTPPQQAGPAAQPSTGAEADAEAAPTRPGTDMAREVACAPHAAQAGARMRSATLRICSKRRPQARHTYS
ncbi:MAG TPA: hypothetical protein VMK65_09580, partial [Longimicrobiales bacterium]|nr:hypothetical protein [Longimicrobiales bacterium]